jgi:hypothetical protein
VRRRGAKLIALTFSPPPKGRAKWGLRLLEDKVVELNIVARVSDNTIGRTLKKRSQSAPGRPHMHQNLIEYCQRTTGTPPFP